MSQYLPPKPRNTPLMSFYSAGETQGFPAPTRFATHSAEPGPAATLSQRNPHFSETMDVKPVARTLPPPAGYQPGMYANRSMGHLGEATLAQGITSLEAMKVAKARAYAGY